MTVRVTIDFASIPMGTVLRSIAGPPMVAVKTSQWAGNIVWRHDTERIVPIDTHPVKEKISPA